ncbi:MAG: hypothetical protein KF746_25790 [Chitinophagaceae bacterium]|nr:hypothetical protein [Chitinophagaceae bacterium]
MAASVQRFIHSPCRYSAMYKNLSKNSRSNCIQSFTKLLFSASLLLSSYIYGQSFKDSAIVKQQEIRAAAIYYTSLKTQSGIYNGSEYVQYIHLLKEGHPYFDTTTFKQGHVLYNKVLYSDVPMLYDIIRDELIVQHFNKVFLVQMIKSKVDWFELYGHRFLHLGRDSTRNGNVKEGFYDVVYDGKIKLYIKRVKLIHESIPNMQVERRVYSKDRYFIYKDDVFHEVNSQSSVLKVLPGHSSELKQVVRSGKIKFRKKREQAINLMVQKYDALN